MISEEIPDTYSGKSIIIKNCVKKFADITALNGLSFDINEGEIFSILGPNGAGKTTLINIMNGLLKPNKGEVFVGGHNIKTDLNEIKKK